MDSPVSTPPPGAPQPTFAAAPVKPVGGLKQFDSKRVVARLIDAVVVGVPSAIAQQTTEEVGAYWFFMALSLIYFFLCEATLAQTLGKRMMGLRVMTREGGAPPVSAVSVRTVLRVIDDGPIGLVVMVLTGERRQRIGDLLAGTTVGGAGREVPRPVASPLLVLYPVAWLIGALAWITLTPSTASASDYTSQATEICGIANVQPELDGAGWVMLLQEMHNRHAALAPPDELAPVHAALVRSDAALVDVMRRAAAAGNNQRALRRLVQQQMQVVQKRRRDLAAYLPGCV